MIRDYVAEDLAERIAALDEAIAEVTAEAKRHIEDAARCLEQITAEAVEGVWWAGDAVKNPAKKWQKACAAGELAGHVLAELQRRRMLLVVKQAGLTK